MLKPSRAWGMLVTHEGSFLPVFDLQSSTDLRFTSMTDLLFDERTLETIEEISGGMSKQEVLDFFEISLDDLQPEDRENFERAYLKGRAIFLRHTINQLKSQMAGRNGVQACLATLARFGSGWESAEDIGKARKMVISLESGDD